ncbi:hypothetical protein IQ288_31685 [Burkholderia sp. R-69980]|nr:hypothetical protein [Burkholderia sp. R-69980]
MENDLVSEAPFTSHFLNNTVIVLDGLPEAESPNARNAFNALRDLSYRWDDLRIEYMRADTTAAMKSTLASILADVNSGCLPIIQFECHGDAHRGFELGDAGQFMSWSELEVPLRKINIASQCNLGVVMAACFGMFAISPLKIDRPSPFYFLLGSQDIVTVGELRSQLPAFYETLFQTASLAAAVEKVPSFQQFHAERLLANTFADYLRRKCMGKGKARRVEDLVTTLNTENPGAINREGMRRARKAAKSLTKAEAQGSSLKRYTKAFLPGRKVSFSFQDLLALAQGSSGDQNLA